MRKEYCSFNVEMEEVQSYEEYKTSQIKMIGSEFRDVLSKVTGSSLRESDKREVLKTLANTILSEI